ncbi:hypothetical protein Sango_3036400 [Sesamum angolense]|uniref:Reverse transcriptase/retrotransposon-derived protein RNase H-like domain-containing protein n=1 Tax=Sesamum angolense TaxID=2727404 RepID=A0AAE1TB62_9LAMI|nr:hypothetical protein Sango_3036400 [Sesamum angolense]
MTNHSRISPDVITHRFNVNPDAKLVKQKKRKFGVERSQAIKEEVEKLLKAKYARPVQYPNGWGVRGKVLRIHDIREREIEANPEKNQRHHRYAASPFDQRCVKLAGRLAALNRFISRTADKGLPFYKVLRGVAKFEWTNARKEVFDGLKRYLASSPLLTKPKSGEILYLYLAISQSGSIRSKAHMMHEGKMAKYLLKAKDMLDKFEQSFLIQVSRADNVVADQLAKLASSIAVICSRRITFLLSDMAALEQQKEVMCADPVSPS